MVTELALFTAVMKLPAGIFAPDTGIPGYMPAVLVMPVSTALLAAVVALVELVLVSVPPVMDAVPATTVPPPPPMPSAMK